MKTVLTTSPSQAAKFIKNGGIVAFPTETVYGLGANVFDEQAIRKIFTAKERPSDNPLIAHVASLDQIKSLVSSINQTSQKLIDAFFPGPLTLVLPKASAVPTIATAGLETVGVRMPRNKLAQEFLEECGVPLVAPSANLSGKPSPTNWEAVFEDLDGRIDCILQGETTEIGLESTVVDCIGDSPIILRKGAVTFEDIERVAPGVKIYQSNPNENPRSPGLKHRHYSPKARVVLFSSEIFQESNASISAFIGVSKFDGDFALTKICDSVTEYALSLFDFFRICDRNGIQTIYCEKVSKIGIGAALIDRIERAASDE